MKRRRLSKLVGEWQPWDYAFNLDVEYEMFRKQAIYYKESSKLQHDMRMSEVCQTLCKLIKIIQGKDSKWEMYEDTTRFVKIDNSEYYQMVGSAKFKDTVYINTRNAYRFLPKEQLEFLKKRNDTWHDLREAKAWYLYNKLRYYQMQNIWD